MKTWKQLAQRALDAQSACNLTGLLRSFSEDALEARHLLDQEGRGGTESINTHYLCVLYSTQVAFLTRTSGSGCEDTELYRKAYEWAKQEVER